MYRYITEKLNLLRSDYETLRAEALHKDKAIENMKREVAQLEEGYERVETGQPVTINLDIRDMTSTDQDELVMASKVLLDRAKQMEASVDELRDVDEQRIRTIAEMVSTMEQRQTELKDKLRDAGLLDEVGGYDILVANLENLKRDILVLSLCFQMQLVPLQRGRVRRREGWGAGQDGADAGADG